MYLKTLFTIILSGFAPLMMTAQDCSYSLSGTVMDYHSKDALVGATVSVIGSKKAVLSNLDGSYRLNGLCAGYIELEVFHPECPTLIIPLNIEENQVYDIKLEHHLEELDEVKVVGNSIADQTNSALEETLHLNELEIYSAGTIGDALKEISGVSSLNTGANIVKPTIHGLNGSRVLILNDGVRMQDMEWGDEHAPNIDVNAARSVSVVKGAAALQYGGDAIGGTIVVDPGRIPQIDSLYGKTMLTGSYNGRGGNLTSELTKSYNNGWFVSGQGSFKRLGDHETPDYVLSNTGVKEAAASVQLGKHLFTSGWDVRYSFFNTELAVLRASHIGNVDDLIRAINSGEPQTIEPFTYDLENPRQKVTHHLAKLKYYNRFEGIGKWTAQYDFQRNRRFEYDIRRGEANNQASIDLLLTTHTFSTDFKWDAKEQFHLQFGILGRYQENFPNPETEVRRLIPDYQKWDVGSFLLGEYRVNDALFLDVGVRYDFTNVAAQKFFQKSRWAERGYDTEFQDLIIRDTGSQYLVNPVFDFHNVTATVGGKYTVSNNGNLRFNYTLAQRAPNPSELFSDGLHHSAARIELGDLRMKSETSHKIAASLEKKYAGWGWTVEPYANFINDFIFLEPTGAEYTNRGAFPVWEYNQTDARLLGLDVMAFSNWSDQWSTEHQFSIVKGKDREADAPLIYMPPANFRNKLVFSKPSWKSFEASLESQYVFQQNEVPGNITVFSPEQQEEVEVAINTAPETYHLMAFTSKLEFPFHKGTKLTTSLSVHNLFNTSFRDYLNRQRYFADDLGRNITLQLKFNY
ncbi:TonB-dependent receptor [Cytophaga sp. FL35]|uniref:TonB-dependent receptor n=1 Tax=Cytophaga sp. FL35 TaxID=1904456 RepID=UPI0016537065|nr:TonB-dependent receptor [Cytophaga sp. FL35]MBC6996975.1 TonB-dependent receptor [Cytophaga sp. FL35]